MKTTDLQKQLAAANKVVETAKKKADAIQAKIKAAAEKKKPKSIYDTVTTLPHVYKHLKVDPKKDVIKIDGFSKEDIECLQNIVSRMRIAKVYNGGKIGQRNEGRWYPWSYLKSGGSGLVFDGSTYDDDHATAGSAARLAFLSEEGSTKYFKNFQNVEEGIIQL
ncbi:MAG: hypothetical protein V4547_17710 [Bacteroidota bacterium]